MKESVQSIILWHETVYPNTTIEEQKNMFHKALSELNNPAITGITELAIMYICACGIGRFSVRSAARYFEICETKRAEYGVVDSDLEKLINATMRRYRDTTLAPSKGKEE